MRKIINNGGGLKAGSKGIKTRSELKILFSHLDFIDSNGMPIRAIISYSI